MSFGCDVITARSRSHSPDFCGKPAGPDGFCDEHGGRVHPAPDPRDARIASLEAENARLEALIVSTVEAATGIDAELHAEYDRIKAKP